jgi:hypothetical protein
MEYNFEIRLRGRPWYYRARRDSLGYELDPAENRGYVLVVPAYLVVEEFMIESSPDSWNNEPTLPLTPDHSQQQAIHLSAG